MTNYPRTPGHAIDSLFTDRWSPRSFTAEPLPEAVLMRMFEAARWAPSSYNYQPWRFLYALRDTPEWPIFLGLLTDVNQIWAFRASALVFILSDSRVMRPGNDQPVDSYTHVFDSGLAYAQLALQATRMGWITHCMQGFDKDRAHSELDVPRDLRINAVTAIGRQGEPQQLSEALQAREKPSDRRPLGDLIRCGKAPPSWRVPAAP
jgi:nitroreductase